jgi:hypothetical protein
VTYHLSKALAIVLENQLVIPVITLNYLLFNTKLLGLMTPSPSWPISKIGKLLHSGQLKLIVISFYSVIIKANALSRAKDKLVLVHYSKEKFMENVSECFLQLQGTSHSISVTASVYKRGFWNRSWRGERSINSRLREAHS